MQEQISEETAREMLGKIIIVSGVTGRVDSSDGKEEALKLWKQAGYIKESALEKARNFISDFKNDHDVSFNALKMQKSLYEQAITELQDKLNEK